VADGPKRSRDATAMAPRMIVGPFPAEWIWRTVPPWWTDVRSRVGDWEADGIIGKDHQGAIVTLAARRSRLLLALPILRTTAELTTQAIPTL